MFGSYFAPAYYARTYFPGGAAGVIPPEPEPEVELEVNLGWSPFTRHTVPAALVRRRRIRLEEDDLLLLGVL